MTTIIDDSEQRVLDTIAQARTAKAALIETMREEIGSSCYTRAKETLPEMDRAIAKIFRPYVEWKTEQEARANTPLPADAKRMLGQLLVLCDTWPMQLRRGLDSWDRLTPPIWKDGHSRDLSQWGAIVFGVRSDLMAGGAWQETLDNLHQQVKNCIRDHNWPAGKKVA